MSLHLYQMAEHYQRLQDMLADGEVDETAIKDTLASVDADIIQKADNCGAMIRTLELEADAVGIEIARLKAKKDALDNNRESLRRYVRFELDAIGKDSIRGPRFYLTIQNNPWKVVIADEKAIPDPYWRVETVRTLDKKAVLEDLKAEKDVPGASKVQERSLRVR